MARSRSAVRNDPISHCPKGQGGRTFARSKKPNNGSSANLGLRQKVQLKPIGKDRFPNGKYRPMDSDT